MMATEAQRRAVSNYDSKLDRVNCRFPKGTLDRIKGLNESKSVNLFIQSAVLEKIELLESQQKTSPD